MPQIRLNKHLADLGIASRREADRFIQKGLIKVNGKIITEMGVKVDPEVDKITYLDEVRETQEKHVYIVLNKPKDYVCSSKATRMDPWIVLDLVDVEERIYPVGRLDKDSTGLIILTNDGTLTTKLIHPSSECEKEYEVTFYSPIPMGSIHKLEDGVRLWGEKTLPTRVEKVGPAKIRIVLKEGKNRQVRRVCQKVGYPVKGLKRIRIKRLHLRDLPIGRWRRLSAQEVSDLKK